MRRSVPALCALLIASAPGFAAAQSAHAPDDAQAHGFDFLMGTWKVQNTFLAKRLQHSHQWLQFEATDVERPLRTATGNLEYYLTSQWPDFVGMGLRLYDPHAHVWTIYWSDNRFSRGVLQPPVRGSFKGHVGVFEGADHVGSLPITVRYTWSSTDHSHARWTQAFSGDGGRTWETNWIMDHPHLGDGKCDDPSWRSARCSSLALRHSQRLPPGPFVVAPGRWTTRNSSDTSM